MKKLLFALVALVLAFISVFTLSARAMTTRELSEGDILVVLDEFALYARVEGDLYRMPIAVGKPGMQDGILGEWEVSRKAEWPTWTPTAAMLKRNCQKYCRWANGMPGGEHNPLGARALYLGTSEYRIHGTNEPDSIGTEASSGCIRMHNKHVVWLANAIEVGATVTVVRYQKSSTSDTELLAQMAEPDDDDESFGESDDVPIDDDEDVDVELDVEPDSLY